MKYCVNCIVKEGMCPCLGIGKGYICCYFGAYQSTGRNAFGYYQSTGKKAGRVGAVNWLDHRRLQETVGGEVGVGGNRRRRG